MYYEEKDNYDCFGRDNGLSYPTMGVPFKIPKISDLDSEVVTKVQLWTSLTGLAVFIYSIFAVCDSEKFMINSSVDPLKILLVLGVLRSLIMLPLKGTADQDDLLVIDRYFVKCLPAGVLFVTNLLVVLFNWGIIALEGCISPTAAAVLLVMLIVRNLIYFSTLLLKYMLSLPAQPVTVVILTALVLSCCYTLF